jgi:hypothetical protein
MTLKNLFYFLLKLNGILKLFNEFLFVKKSISTVQNFLLLHYMDVPWIILYTVLSIKHIAKSVLTNKNGFFSY